MASDTLLAPAPHEPDEADGADPEHLEGVPDRQQNQQVEPAGTAVVGDRGADRRSVDVGHGEEHRGDAPLEAAPGTDRAQQQVRGRVPEQAVASLLRFMDVRSIAGLFPRHSATVFRRGGGYEPSAREGPSRRTRVVC